MIYLRLLKLPFHLLLLEWFGRSDLLAELVLLWPVYIISVPALNRPLVLQSPSFQLHYHYRKVVNKKKLFVGIPFILVISYRKSRM